MMHWKPADDFCSILSLRPEPKSGEQICRLFSEVDVIRSKRPALPPDR